MQSSWESALWPSDSMLSVTDPVTVSEAQRPFNKRVITRSRRLELTFFTSSEASYLRGLFGGGGCRGGFWSSSRGVGEAHRGRGFIIYWLHPRLGIQLLSVGVWSSLGNKRKWVSLPLEEVARDGGDQALGGGRPHSDSEPAGDPLDPTSPNHTLHSSRAHDSSSRSKSTTLRSPSHLLSFFFPSSSSSRRFTQCFQHLAAQPSALKPRSPLLIANHRQRHSVWSNVEIKPLLRCSFDKG